MSDANFEVCLLAWPVREVINELRVLLRPLRGLHHEILDSVEANYGDACDALLLRLRFSKAITETSLQKRLVGHLGGLGLEMILPQNLSPFERVKFEEQLRDQYRFHIQRYPTARTPSVLPGIFDALEAHLASRERRLTTEIDPEPTRVPLGSGLRQPRSLTQDALDLVISELRRPPSMATGSSDSLDVLSEEPVFADLPIRADTFGALDEMIANLPPRPGTFDALDDIIEELQQ